MKRFKTTYIIALLVIAVLVIMGELAVQFALTGLADDARVINLSGKQRMLSQRITKNALVMGQTSSLEVFQTRKRELTEALNDWRKSHDALQKGDVVLGIKNPPNNQEILGKYAEAQPIFEQMKEAASKLSALDFNTLDSVGRAEMNANIEIILNSEAKFLPLMDDITNLYAQDSKKRSNVASLTAWGVGISILVAIVLLAIFFFEPVVKKMNEYIEEIEKQTKKLKASEIEMREIAEKQLEANEQLFLAQRQLQQKNAELEASEKETKRLLEEQEKANQKLAVAQRELQKNLVEQNRVNQKLVEANEQLFLAQKQIQEQAQKMKQAFIIAKSGAWMLEANLDGSSAIITLSDEYFAILNTSIEEQGKYEFPFEEWMSKFVIPEDHSIITSCLGGVLQNAEYSTNIEVRLKHSTLGFIYTNTVISTRHDVKTGKVIGQGTAQDITERKKAEEEVRRLSLVASKTDNAVVITDGNGLIEWVNDAFVRLTEYTLEEVKGRKPGSFLQGPETNVEDVEMIRNNLRSRVAFSHEIYNYSKSGKGYWLALSITPILNESGDVVQFIAIESDITERKKNLERIKKSEEEMRLLAEAQLEANEKLLGAQKELQEQTMRLKSAFQIAKIGSWQLEANLDGTNAVLIFSDEYYNLLDTSVQEQGSYTLPFEVWMNKFVYEEDIPIVINGLRDAISNPKYQTILEFRLKKADGSIIYNLATIDTQHFVSEGKIRGQGLGQDITELKKAEEEVRRLSLVASKTDNAVVITDGNGLIEWVNDAFVRLTEYTLEEVKGRKPGSFLQGPETNVEDVEIIRNNLRSRVAFSHEIYNYSKSGKGYWLALSITPILNESGDVVQFIAIESDITERKKSLERIKKSEEEIRLLAEAQLEANERLMMAEKNLKDALELEKKQKAELDRLVRQLKDTQTQLVHNEKMASLGQLTAGIAHEINNPINFVYNGIDTLKISLDDLMEIVNKYNELDQANGNKEEIIEEVKALKNDLGYEELIADINHLVSDIKKGAVRTMEIVKGLRVFSRLDEEERKMASIKDCLESTLILLNNKIKNKITLKTFYDESMPEILCYPGQLNQVFMNIINNAIQAIPEEKKDGEIVIYTENQQENVVIRIKDNGVGMSEQVKRRIFEPFFTTKPVGVGTGLGLSITFGIIEKHGGSIFVNSEEGRGTEFVIQLPKVSH